MDLVRQRQQARKAFESGEVVQAIDLQRALVDTLDLSDPAAIDDLLFLVQYLSADRQLDEATQLLEAHKATGAGRFDYCLNLGCCYMQQSRMQDALSMLLAARKLEPESADVHVRLARVFRLLEQEQEALRCGELALLLKAKQTLDEKVWPLPEERPDFRRDQPGRNVIAFAIPFATPEYLNGALANAMYAPIIFPGWTCRFYFSGELPRDFLRQMVSCGVSIAQVSGRGKFREPASWPLHIFSDRSVDFFLIRDVRALVNVRERVAVDAWLESGRFFHVMRDHWSQTELLPQGMWGGVANVLPAVSGLLKGYRAPSVRSNWLGDLLASRVWPTVRQSCLVHDSNYQAFGAQPFPAYGALPPGQYVGQDQRGWRQVAPFSALQAEMRDLQRAAGNSPWAEELPESSADGPGDETGNPLLYDKNDILI